ncbi:MAG: hypothetical protein IIV44_05365 [Rikenellaceae bacterium]|nr:hypothetical protein [Clostridia bacterium]MBQ5679336.1 hypothetical protein [Rikenellaceae bacterium]
MAKELKLTQTLTGWFDVRVYNERIARENRQIKGDNDNIGFTASFAVGDPAAVAFATYGKPYADANGNPRLRVNFKIGRKCRWFDENANPVAKPANMDLDGKMYEVVMQYNEVAGDPTKPLSPKGYWVDAIQFREAQVNPFAAMAGAAPVPPIHQQQPQPQQYQQQQHQQYQQPQPQPQQQQQPQYQQQQPTGNIGFPPPPVDDIISPRGMSAPIPPMYNDSDNFPF